MKVEILTEDQAVKGLSYPIEVKVYEAGVQLKPSSAAITVKDPDGTTVIDAAAMTVNGTTGTMTYTLAAANTATLWENAILEISYVISTVTYKAVFFFDVVLNQLKCNVIDSDLKNYAPQIASEIWTEESNYDTQIQEAFKIVKRDIKDKGKRPCMLIDGSQVRELIILETFELICFDFSKSPEDIWWARYLKYCERYSERLQSLMIKYDSDEDGLIDDEEKDKTLGQVSLVR